MIKNQEIGFTKGSKSRMESGWLFIRFQLAYYMLGTTTTTLSNAVSGSRVVVIDGVPLQPRGRGF